MKKNRFLLSGPVAAVFFCSGVIVLGAAVPHYSSVHQTVSEIGEQGSVVEIPFTIMLCITGCCLFGFAKGIRDASVKAGHSTNTSWFVIAMGLSSVGVGLFAFPHSLHNFFGISEVVGYQAPLVFALSWRKETKARKLLVFSWIIYCLVVIALLLNMSPLLPSIWVYLSAGRGIIQRLLFLTWFTWCTVTGLRLYFMVTK